MPRVRGDLGSEKKGPRSSTLMLTLIGGVMRQRAGLQMCDVASHQVVDIFAAQPINQPINRRTALLRTAATAAMMPLMPAAFAADDLGKARTQLSASVDALDDVLRRYDAIVLADGGNGIRRVLGKLGPTSPLYRIDKAVNIVARDIDDDGAFESNNDGDGGGANDEKVGRNPPPSLGGSFEQNSLSRVQTRTKAACKNQVENGVSHKDLFTY